MKQETLITQNRALFCTKIGLVHVKNEHEIYLILTTVLNKNDKLDIYYVELASNGIILMTKISLEILNPGKINYEL